MEEINERILKFIINIYYNTELVIIRYIFQMTMLKMGERMTFMKAYDK
jgi:hypothetical protein